MSQEGDVRIGGVEAGGGEPENQVEQPAGGEVEEGTTPPTMSAEEAQEIARGQDHVAMSQEETTEEIPPADLPDAEEPPAEEPDEVREVERRGPPTREEREREATARLHEKRAEGNDL